MNTVKDIIYRREKKDLEEYDSFLAFVTVCPLPVGRIVQREGYSTYYGVVDDNDKILLPIVFDAIDVCLENTALRLVIKDESTGHYYKGLWNIGKRKMILDVAFDDVQTSICSEHLWCKRNEDWFFCQMSDGKIVKIPQALALLESYHYRCALRKDPFSDNLLVVCLDNEGLERKSELRSLALEQMKLGGDPGRIHLFNDSMNLEITSNVYGQVLFSNFNNSKIL